MWSLLPSIWMDQLESSLVNGKKIEKILDFKSDLIDLYFLAPSATPIYKIQNLIVRLQNAKALKSAISSILDCQLAIIQAQFQIAVWLAKMPS